MVNGTKAIQGAPCGAPTPGIGDILERLSAPFAPEEVKVRRGPRGDMRYITARVARRRLNEVLGVNWSCRIEPAEKWVKCSLTITLPDGTRVTREALGGYADMPSEEDKVKSGDSDAFKRCCVLFGVGEYLYGDDPDTPAEPRCGTVSHTSMTSNERPATPTEATGESQLSFANAREFYAFVKRNGLLGITEAWANANNAPLRILRWTDDQIRAATAAILERTNGHVR